MDRQLPLQQFLAQESKDGGQRIFLRQPIGGGIYKDFSWAQAGQEARKMAQVLKNHNFPPGSRIAILSKNCAHWVIADLAIWMAGHISVPLYPTLNPETITQILEHSESKFIFIGKLDEWPRQRPGVPTNIPSVAFPYWKNDGVTDWNELIKDVAPLSSVARPAGDDICTIIYTSGTTGVPKGVVHTFRSISFPIHEAIDEVKIYPSDRFLSYLPLSHIAERFLVEMGALYSGGTIFFAESIESFKHDLKFCSPTIFLAVPTIWLKFQQGVLAKMPNEKLQKILRIPLLGWLVKKKICKELGLSKVRLPITGAAPIAPELMKWFQGIGISILEVYGMTENFGYATFNFPGRVKLGTVGEKWKNTELKISESGEILTRSPATMQGYYKEPEKTREVIDEQGWLHSGDKGEIDSDGYLKITGRVKDLFKTAKGKYVAPAPIEKHFSMCELIDMVCVLGQGLSAPLAVITLSEIGKKKSNDVLKNDLFKLLEEINHKIENYERLGRVVVVQDKWTVETGVLTPTLKIKRNVVEEMYSGRVAGWLKIEEKIILI